LERTSFKLWFVHALAAQAASEELARSKVEMSSESADDAVGRTIDRYKLLDKVGERGCGVVYIAEQTEPSRFLARRRWKEIANRLWCAMVGPERRRF
jgi:hypothetical protein